MASADYTIRLDVTGRDSGATAALDRANASAQRLSHGFTRVGENAQAAARQAESAFGRLSQIQMPSLGGLVGGLGAGFAIHHAITRFSEAQRETQLLASTIKQAGGDTEQFGRVIDKTAAAFVQLGVAGKTEVERVARQLISVGASAQELPALLEQTFRVAAAKGADADTILKRLLFTMNDKTPEERLAALRKSMGELAKNAPELGAVGNEMTRFKIALQEAEQALGGVLSKLALPVLKDIASVVSSGTKALDEFSKTTAGSVLLGVGGAAAKTAVELILIVKAVQLMSAGWAFLVRQGASVAGALGMTSAASTRAATTAGVHTGATQREALTLQAATLEAQRLTVALGQLSIARAGAARAAGAGAAQKLPLPPVTVPSPVSSPVFKTPTAAPQFGGRQGFGSALGGLLVGSMVKDVAESFGASEGTSTLAGFAGATATGAAVAGPVGAAVGAATYSIAQIVPALMNVRKARLAVVEANKQTAKEAQEYAYQEIKSGAEIEAMTDRQRGEYIEALRAKQRYWVASMDAARLSGKETGALEQQVRAAGEAIREFQKLSAEKKLGIQTAKSAADAERAHSIALEQLAYAARQAEAARARQRMQDLEMQRFQKVSRLEAMKAAHQLELAELAAANASKAELDKKALEQMKAAGAAELEVLDAETAKRNAAAEEASAAYKQAVEQRKAVQFPLLAKEQEIRAGTAVVDERGRPKAPSLTGTALETALRERDALRKQMEDAVKAESDAKTKMEQAARELGAARQARAEAVQKQKAAQLDVMTKMRREDLEREKADAERRRQAQEQIDREQQRIEDFEFERALRREQRAGKKTEKQVAVALAERREARLKEQRAKLQARQADIGKGAPPEQMEKAVAEAHQRAFEAQQELEALQQQKKTAPKDSEDEKRLDAAIVDKQKKLNDLRREFHRLLDLQAKQIKPDSPEAKALEAQLKENERLLKEAQAEKEDAERGKDRAAEPSRWHRDLRGKPQFVPTAVRDTGVGGEIEAAPMQRFGVLGRGWGRGLAGRGGMGTLEHAQAVNLAGIRAHQEQNLRLLGGQAVSPHQQQNLDVMRGGRDLPARQPSKPEKPNINAHFIISKVEVNAPDAQAFAMSMLTTKEVNAIAGGATELGT